VLRAPRAGLHLAVYSGCVCSNVSLIDRKEKCSWRFLIPALFNNALSILWIIVNTIVYGLGNMINQAGMLYFKVISLNLLE
jgi:hypothetical protein